MEMNTTAEMPTPEQIKEAHKIWRISNGRHEGGKWRVHNTETNASMYLATKQACVYFIENTVASKIAKKG
jgi:hypothetical protein